MGETKREKRELVEDFADFCRFGLDLQGKWFGAAENRRKPQETAENPQETVSTPFSRLVSPSERCPKLAQILSNKNRHWLSFIFFWLLAAYLSGVPNLWPVQRALPHRSHRANTKGPR